VSGRQASVGGIFRNSSVRDAPLSRPFLRVAAVAAGSLNRDGTGEGKIVTPAKISWNKETQSIEITNYGTEPVRLTRVEVAERNN
jgi:hypothetical protein